MPTESDSFTPRVRYLHGHTGTASGEPCFEWDGRIGLCVALGHRHTPHYVWRAADGTRRGSSHRWLVVTCNTPDCKYEALLSADDIERQLESRDDYPFA